MPIPTQYASRYVYHFTHIENLPLLLKYGFLANNHPNFPAAHSKSVAAESIQERRAGMAVTCGANGVVHDYVPFYFGSLSLMLLGVINRKNIDQCDILYFEFPISLLNRSGAVFTDASANTGTPPNFYDDLNMLKNLNWLEIDSLKWSCSSEVLRHQRMAETLIPYSVDLQSASRVVVWNESVKKRVENLVSGFKFPPIEFESQNRRHYFTKFQDPTEKGKGITLVAGPKEVNSKYLDACNIINNNRIWSANPKFIDLDALLNNLRADFGCLPHTSELIGLRSENGMHKRTVDVHTYDVVNKLLSLEEYKNLPRFAQKRVELATYLHDIGKGPKSRWTWNQGLQKVDPDHAVRAMPMMAEIFVNYVAKVKSEIVESILKLVCYHDLIGEVIGKERDVKQIIDVANDSLELDMLFAIGKADATALSETWWDDEQANNLYDYCLDEINSRNQDDGY